MAKSVFCKYADFKQLGGFFVFQKNCCKIVAFFSDKTSTDCIQYEGYFFMK